MKSIITVVLFTASLVLLSFRANETKLLSVSYSVDDWTKKINMIEYTKNVLKNSSVPANIVLPLSDSLTKFQNEMVIQLQGQIKADSTKKK